MLGRRTQSLLALGALLALAGCDYHQTLRPTTLRAASGDAADVTLASVGYDNVSLSVEILVHNRAHRPLTFHPERVHLRVGDESAEPLTGPMTGGSSAAGAALQGVVRRARVGGRGGLAIAATGVLVAGVDAVIVLAINEATRGPYTSTVQEIGAEGRARYTLQFPVRTREGIFLVPSVDAHGVSHDLSIPLQDGCRLSLEDALSVEGEGHPLRLDDLAILAVNEPHYGFSAPELPRGVYFFRIGGGPGFGRTEGVGGIEIAAGPRWGRTALAFTATLGFGFPVGIEMRRRWLDTGAVHATATFGHTVWFFPGGIGQGLRGGMEFGLKFPEAIFGWPYQDWSVGVYARGGPVLYPGRSGGELDFGVLLGEF